MSTQTMPVLKVEIEGTATSFRYPYFSQGVQPTYEVPPPATLYGLICSVLGDYVDPSSFRLGFHFTYESRWFDYEHTYLLVGDRAKLSPFEREILFRPRLTLYIDQPEWSTYFRNPHYVVTLGRSQDLMCIRRVEEMYLSYGDAAYLEHTVTPIQLSSHLQFWISLMLPRYITPDRQVAWGQYALLTRRQLVNLPMLCDEETELWRGAYRGVQWLTLMD